MAMNNNVALKQVGIIGGGQMGAWIAQVAIQNGIEVTLVDISQDVLDSSCASIVKGLSRLVTKEKITEHAKKEALGRLTATSSIESLAGVPFIIEAITENEEVKKKVFGSLDEICEPETIFASNTSSISITRLGAATSRPDKVVGMHFFNPVPIMRLIEIIRSPMTSDATVTTVHALADKLGKTAVDATDSPGFIVNRILLPMINEAMFALFEGVASADDIDTAMVLGTNQPIGPLSLADFIGLDTCLAVMRVLHEDLGDPKYRPCPMLVRYVDAGWLGRKTSRGFFTYDENGKRVE